MRKLLNYCVFFATILMIMSCEKSDVVPPRSDAFIRDYVLPEPEFLSAEERELVREQRDEYNKL